VTARGSRRLVVVGGGLAGLGAAVEARRAGLETCVVEQRSTLRGPRRLLAEFEASGAEAVLETSVWGIWGRDLALCGANGQSSVLSFEHLIIATGAFERPVAFPGWTLPGVMTLGRAVRLLEQGVTPGQRVVVSGYASFVSNAAVELKRFGVTALAVLDAAVRGGRLPVRALGTERLEGVVTSRVDGDWRPRTGTQESLQADTLVLAFGSISEDRLARLAGCDVVGSAYIDPQTKRDAWLRTTVPGVLVAGDAGGIAGSNASMQQGRLAGLAAAMDAGCLSEDDALRRARPIQRRLLQYARIEPPRPGLFTLADPETIICCCEDVTAAQITERIFEGSIDPAGVIAETRAAMGLCQGRNCASLVAATVARDSGVPLESIPPITARPPIVPVPLGVLAERPPVFSPMLELSAAG
jgi:D-hydroxyproline dehydrogenase subunit alpha